MLDAPLAHVVGQLVSVDVAQQVDQPLDVEAEDVLVERLALDGDAQAQLGDGDEAALGGAAFTLLTQQGLEVLVDQIELLLGVHASRDRASTGPGTLRFVACQKNRIKVTAAGWAKSLFPATYLRSPAKPFRTADVRSR